jgi:hypothetical protein
MKKCSHFSEKKKSGFTRSSITTIIFCVILNLVNPDFIIIIYHFELTPNSYEMTFLRVNFNFLLVEPGLDALGGTLDRIVIRGKYSFIICKRCYDSGGVLRNVCCVHRVQ